MDPALAQTLLTIAGPNALAAFIGIMWLRSMQATIKEKDAIIARKDQRIEALSDTLFKVGGETAKLVADFIQATKAQVSR